MSVPTPQPGLVISYGYLWAREHGRGIEEGGKDRPCAIIAARQIIEGREVVTVVPITHTLPTDPADAIEIPPALKVHLGLDGLPSLMVCRPGLSSRKPTTSYGLAQICDLGGASNPAALTKHANAETHPSEPSFRSQP